MVRNIAGPEILFIIAYIHSNIFLWHHGYSNCIIYLFTEMLGLIFIVNNVHYKICHDRYDAWWISIIQPQIFWVYYILCVASIDTRCYTYVNQDSNPHIWSAKSILKGINADNNVIHSHVYIAIEFFTSNKVVTLKMDDICFVEICY